MDNIDNILIEDYSGRIFGGIDPGTNGAVCLISEDGRILFRDCFPLFKGKLDVSGLKNLLMNTVKYANHVFLEDVHAVFGSSAGATFSFGWNCGLIEGILTAQNKPFTMISPKEWQKEMWRGIDVLKMASKTGKKVINDTKGTSLLSARRLFPNETFLSSPRCNKPHDGIIDAVLMAECCRRKIK